VEAPPHRVVTKLGSPSLPRENVRLSLAWSCPAAGSMSPSERSANGVKGRAVMTAVLSRSVYLFASASVEFVDSSPVDRVEAILRRTPIFLNLDESIVSDLVGSFSVLDVKRR
jgi:hypothetical protein